MPRDATVEEWLTSQNVRWELVEGFPLADIDISSSRANQARLRGPAIDPELVTDYVAAMSAGDEFPPLIGYRARRGLVLIGGNHRDEAARRIGRETFAVYVVDESDPYVIERLTRTANSKNGMRPDRAELAEHAMYLIERYNRDITEVSKELGMSKNWLQNHMSAAKGRDRLRALGRDVTRLASSSKFLRLNAIQNDPAMAAAFDLACDAALDENEVSQLVTEVRAKRSEAEQINVVLTWRDRIDIHERVTNRGHVRKRGWPARQQMLSAMTRLERILERYDDLAQMQLTSDSDLERLRAQWTDIKFRMEKNLAQGRTEVRARRPRAVAAG